MLLTNHSFTENSIPSPHPPSTLLLLLAALVTDPEMLIFTVWFLPSTPAQVERERH